MKTLASVVLAGLFPTVAFVQIQTSIVANSDRGTAVDWQMISHGNSVHVFTVPSAGNDKPNGTAYNEKADKRSWEAMKSFFKEIFATPVRL